MNNVTTEMDKRLTWLVFKAIFHYLSQDTQEDFLPLDDKQRLTDFMWSLMKRYSHEDE